MKDIKVLDVTLRDGGCVNDFDFGNTYMREILSAQENAKIDIIELGYIDEKKGSNFDRTQYLSEKVIPQAILKEKKQGVSYVAMIDYGKYDIDSLANRTPDGIDGIRIAFHKKNIKDVIPLGRKIIEKGYELYIQPMITFRYSDEELLGLIKRVNEYLPDASAFYIVDSFGEMRTNDINRVISLVDHNLLEGMTIGLHSHNNLQLSYSNACALLDFPTTRSIILDTSIMGMGKGAGNLGTELLLEHLNKFYDKEYKIDPLLEVIDGVINQLHDEFKWGYAIEYYLSSVNHCTPSYSAQFYNKHMLPIDRVNELLSTIPEEKRISFDRDFAENVYRKFNDENPVNDHVVVEKLKSEFEGCKVLLVAPGKSVLSAEKLIDERIKDDNCKVIGLNATIDVDFDYILTTRHDIFMQKLSEGKRLIVPSSLVRSCDGDVKVLNYLSWIETNGGTHDSSSVIALNLMKACQVKEVELIGFDGFSTNINENYYDNNMRRPISIEQQSRRNAYYKGLIERVAESGIKVVFLTPSLYEE